MTKDELKEVFSDKNRGKYRPIPSDKMLGYLSFMYNYLLQEGQLVEIQITGDEAYFYVEPADIAIGAYYEPDKKEWIKIGFHPGRMRDERALWEGSFGNWIQEALSYKKGVFSEKEWQGIDFADYIKKLLTISARYYELYPMFNEVSEKLGDDCERLDVGAKADIRKVVAGSFRSFKDELLDILVEKSFQYFEEPIFKLVSGRMSQFYVNCRPVVLDPRGMFLTGNLVFDAISDIENLVGVGGLTFGADPIAVATAYTSEIKGQPIKAFSIRKTQKDHGIVKWIEGDMSQGDRVAIIDDVATTGGSTIKAIERARADGLDVVAVVILVDRQEGGIKNILEHVSGVRVIFTREELFSAYQAKKPSPEVGSFGPVS